MCREATVRYLPVGERECLLSKHGCGEYQDVVDDCPTPEEDREWELALLRRRKEAKRVKNTKHRAKKKKVKRE